MIIQIDSREKARAIKKIIKYFGDNQVRHYVSKLLVGDYMNLDNPKVIVDRKQNLNEICSNVTSDHNRFRAELIKAKECGIKLVILCEHGKGIESIEDLLFWDNPMSHKRIIVDGTWTDVDVKAMSGPTLAKILMTLESKYGCEFQFCDKADTGKRILEIIGKEG